MAATQVMTLLVVILHFNHNLTCVLNILFDNYLLHLSHLLYLCKASKYF